MALNESLPFWLIIRQNISQLSYIELIKFCIFCAEQIEPDEPDKDAAEDIILIKSISNGTTIDREYYWTIRENILSLAVLSTPSNYNQVVSLLLELIGSVCYLNTIRAQEISYMTITSGILPSIQNAIEQIDYLTKLLEERNND